MGEVTRDGACVCGQLEVTAHGEPRLVGACHCQACQRRTGSALGVVAFFSKDRVETRGDYSTFERVAESGARLVFHFCPRCGSNVYWTRDTMPDAVAVAVGAFADPSFPGPSRRVWTESAHDWTEGLADLPAYPKGPTG